MSLHRQSSCLIFLAAAGIGGGALARAADENPAPDMQSLKTLSLDELTNLEVTSVSKRAQKLSETASAIAVVTQNDVLRSGASRLPDALRLAGNLEIAQINAAQWAISARGFNALLSNKLLVLIDGRTVYTPLFSGVFWEAQDVLFEDLDRIEVITGPGATVWGANAVNGVINITTRTARDTQGLYLEAGAGTTLQPFGAARYGAALGPDTHFRVYGKYSGRDSALLSSGQDPGNDLRHAQGGFRLDSQLTGDDLLTVQGDLYDNTITLSGPGEILTRGANLLGRWSHRASSGSEYKVQLYADRVDRDVSNSYEDTLSTYDFDFQHQLPAGSRHNIVWGAGYRLVRDNFVSPSIGLQPARAELKTINAFVQDEIVLAPDKLHLTVGTKIEDNDYTGAELQPSVRLAWQLREKQMLWSAVSRAVRTPARIDRDYYIPPVIFGSPDLESETLLAYELGYRVRPHERVSLSVAGYYHDYDDLRSIEPVNPPAPIPVEFLNGQEGESYGVELSAEYRVTDAWRLRADIAELRLQIRPKAGSRDNSRGRLEAADSEHHLLLRSSLDLPRNVQFDATYRYVSRVANPQYAIGGYGELDVRLGWLATQHLELSIVGQHLLRDRHGEIGAPPGRQEMERGAYAKVAWRF